MFDWHWIMKFCEFKMPFSYLRNTCATFQEVIADISWKTMGQRLNLHIHIICNVIQWYNIHKKLNEGNFLIMWNPSLKMEKSNEESEKECHNLLQRIRAKVFLHISKEWVDYTARRHCRMTERIYNTYMYDTTTSISTSLKA